MKIIVITGSSRGLGLALADGLLGLDCSVMLCGRSQTGTDLAVAEMTRRYGNERVDGFPCDVKDASQVQALWDAAQARFGRIDIWINNAGLSNQQAKIWHVPDVEMASVVETNLLGVIYGSQVAVRGMLEQGYGALYNMQGMGSDGRMHDGLIPYGTTKYAISYFTNGLAKELKGSPVIVGALRPGMLVTDMLTSQYEGRPEDFARAKRIFNIIADRPEVVGPWLAQRILANQRSGVCISYSSSWKLTWRFLTAPFSRRNLFPDENR